MEVPQWFVLCLVLVVTGTGDALQLAAKEFSSNISSLLESLLDVKNYDRRIRPGIGGPPVQVKVNLLIKSLGPVNEDESKYSMDIYFRQTWHDKRLAFSMPGVTELSMSWLFLEKIWKPDTYFVNGKKSHLHRITSPNKFVRVRQDGLLSSSMRLTLTASCKMYLKKFPLDSQTCPLLIGSYAYTLKDMVYKWDTGGVVLEPGVGMAQYDVKNISIKDGLIAQRAQGQFSVIMTNFHLKRSTGYFLLQIYVPCCLIVCCSWIGFWITPNDAAGRTCLGATTVLSITTLGFGGRATLPKVPHATALDWFVIICFSFAFTSLIEFASISFTAKLLADLKKLKEEEEKKEAERKAQEEALKVAENDEIRHMDEEEGTAGMSIRQNRKYVFLPHRWYSIPTDLSGQASRDDLGSAVFSCPSRSSHVESPVPWYRRIILVPFRYYQRCRGDKKPRDADKEQPSHATKMDNFARIAFPVSFISILTTYGVLYTYYITDKEADDESMIGFFKVD
ncbi:hypothetical protein GE061_006156 [Apolygus lucorum]|uniref:Gamma-aminobutyric acid receptor subunit beta n=1 Tax=Apolygus lucorum TaxID=248454 RepID=A0A6A4JBY8_APOLU|nr:hypothetical protein GE061_006156 [Apolygus lucorum]